MSWQKPWSWVLLVWWVGGVSCYHPTFRTEDNKSSESATGGTQKLCPQTMNDRYVVMAGNPFSIEEIGEGLLSNDQDPENEMLTVVEGSFVSEHHGVGYINANGTFSYNPPMKFWGGDTFTYKVIDSQGCETEGAVLISVHPRTISLADVAQGYGGFALDGEAETDRSGSSVSSAGDVNNDGFADLLVGAYGSDPEGKSYAGRTYVVWGGPNHKSLSLSSVQQGQGGFALDGEAVADHSGRSVSSAGDVNGDGFTDLLVGAYRSSPLGQGKSNMGRTYVVWGGPNLTSLSLNNIQQAQGGFALDGEAAEDHSGCSVSSAGDVNGDGFADLLVGAAGFSPPDVLHAGRTYIVFGGLNLTSLSLSSIQQAQGGFALDGEAAWNLSGELVSSAGDVNNDGFADLLVGVYRYSIQAKSTTGRTYIVFGGPNLISQSLSSVQQNQGGFALDGEAAEDRSGSSVSSAGDVNGDGFADFLVGANGSDPNGQSEAGRSYVIFGGPNLTSISLNSIQQDQGGFALDGEEAGNYSGSSVNSAGDVNGDGFADLLVSAPWSSPAGQSEAGRSYVIFGGPNLTSISLNSIQQGQGGFALDGEATEDHSGWSVSSAGDVNGDGFADLLVGAPWSNPEGKTSAGRTYVIYGGDFTGSVTFRPTPNNDRFEGTSQPESILGGLGDDELLGNGGADVLYGGPGDDILSIADANFFRIDGGPGQDTLRLDGTNMHLDLSKISELALQNIEIIDLNGQDNQLTLERRDLVASSDTSNILVIHGQPSNTISADFTATDFKYLGSTGDYIEYRSANGNGPLRLWIQPSVTRNISVNP